VSQAESITRYSRSPGYRNIALAVRRGPVAEAKSWLEGVGHGSFYHRPEWLTLIEEQFGHETYTVLSREAGRLNGVLPLVRLRSRLFGDYMVSLPFVNYGGACAESRWLEGQLMQRAAQCAASLGVRHVEFRDTRTQEFPGLVVTRKVSMWRSLPAESNTLWREVGAKRRSQVRRARKEGARVMIGGIPLIHEFYSVFSRNMRDLGTPVYPKSFFRAIFEYFPPESRFVVVSLRDRAVAAGILLGHGGTLEIPWASSLKSANRYGVNMLLYWEALKYAIEQGYETFDFGRSTVDSGSYRFKKQWGAQAMPLYWHYWLRRGASLPDLSPQNPKYQTAIRLWKHLPVPLTRMIGPMIVKSLP